MLTSRQRAYLRSLGNQMDPIFQIGKGGLTKELLTQLDNALEARELIKVRVLRNCIEEPSVLAEDVSDSTGAEIVQKIGRNFLIYRESVEKLKIKLPDSQ